MWTFILWLILLVVCWPLALLALVLYPIVWLLLLPFRLIGITVDAVFKFLHSILLLPARVLRGPTAGKGQRAEKRDVRTMRRVAPCSSKRQAPTGYCSVADRYR